MKAFSPAVALLLTLAALHAEPVVLENRWIKAVVDPSAGGRVVQLLHKPTGRQFTEALTLNDAPGGSGLFNDRFWKRRQTRDLETSPYEVTHAEPGVRVDMVRAHRGRGTDAFLVKKSFRLPRERASLIAEYQMENLGASDWEGRVWIAGLVRPSSAVDESITFHFPMQETQGLEARRAHRPPASAERCDHASARCAAHGHSGIRATRQPGRQRAHRAARRGPGCPLQSPDLAAR